ncbi:methyltransferase family protein [Oceanisphaera pacifica]|uniref:Isoprenylcysteine carboxylmethyltransferase family protein n=1 Tax=Oceanisphaera pacifica TaxID=2818389 RepID=A0ABS3ND57_9GAMM|nr:isoprenylcysteine carboxylmethyltransferase family protein [Oceanisphaera pacifica]MBO1518529.1 isoprenylcysteine carboxylmethyltransferase family protein [Oceanisphaera pacifica]
MNINQWVRWCPPPVMVAFIMGGMWLSQTYLLLNNQPIKHFLNGALLPLVLGLVAFAIAIMVVAAWQFRQANTTLLPFAPEQTQQLVTKGIFRYSRNPIYVGDACIVLAWGLWLGHWAHLIGLVLFVIYMNKVQIALEERALMGKFGATYHHYCQRVRPWL